MRRNISGIKLFNLKMFQNEASFLFIPYPGEFELTAVLIEHYKRDYDILEESLCTFKIIFQYQRVAVHGL